ncbi:DUF4922 domain-containing protein [Nitrogeniibacter aestuarii]|uniref:DUF4922 domain-containing protein n=1 Tax=Nitrogeniibacter aestuarii TaxID=2815343 RepID=UPI001E33E269|nr:DUF4922 domain-containing protein [Nitrogeniibacter aestuarii]
MPDILIPTEHQIDEFVHAALARGVLLPIATESRIVEHEGLPFLVKWVSTQALKPRVAKPGRQSAHNPFAQPEPALTLGDIAPRHRLLLNKFPVMSRHLLIVTRDFEPQEDALCADDFAAIAPLIERNAGLGFYNGGALAGASQAHKHLQWIPQCPPLAQCLPEALSAPLTPLDFRHAFMPLDPGLWTSGNAGPHLLEVYRSLLERAGLPAGDHHPAPYNLLLTRGWMWLIPRRAEHWREMSINALGFAGSLFVKRQEALDELVSAGPMNALRAVACRR